MNSRNRAAPTRGGPLLCNLSQCPKVPPSKLGSKCSQVTLHTIWLLAIWEQTAGIYGSDSRVSGQASLSWEVRTSYVLPWGVLLLTAPEDRHSQAPGLSPGVSSLLATPHVHPTEAVQKRQSQVTEQILFPVQCCKHRLSHILECSQRENLQEAKQLFKASQNKHLLCDLLTLAHLKYALPVNLVS